MNDNNYQRPSRDEPAWPTGEDPDLGRDPSPAVESTGEWRPEWEDRPSAGDVANRLGADQSRSNPRHRRDDADASEGPGKEAEQNRRPATPPTTRRQQPPPGQQPPPRSPQAQQGGGRPVQQRPPEHETEMLPLVLDDMHRSSAREPELLTHREDEHPDPAGPHETPESTPAAATGGGGGGGGGRRPPRGPAGGEGPGRRRWRRARRTIYVLIGLGIVIPAVAFFVAYQFVDAPSPEAVIAKQNQPVTFYWANGDVMYKNSKGQANRKILKADEIPASVKHAVFAAEDASFKTNSGFDIKGIFRAAFSHVTSSGGGGASTITQQYVKKATGNNEHSYARKALEVVRAFKLTNTQSKSDILTGYLNIVYFGRGAYGIGAAAQTYFGTDAAHLTPEQSAFLAGLIQGPSRNSDKQYVHDRWSYVMDEMAAHHWISTSERQSAKLPERVPYQPKKEEYFKGKQYLRFVVDRVKGELAAKGLDEKKLRHEGAKIHLGIDPKAEKKAVSAAQDVMSKDHHTSPNSAYKNLASAMVSADPKTGQILAYYGGDWNRTKYDQAGLLPHNPGSSFKPIDFAAAMRQDPSIGIGSTYDGTNHQKFAGGVTIDNAGGEGCGKECSVMRGMTHSVNTVFYNMVFHMPGGNGPGKVGKMAHDLGIAKKQRRGGCDNRVPSLVNIKNCKSQDVTNAGIAIGSYPVTVKDMTQAYQTMANRGKRIPLHFVTKVTDNSGENVLYQFSNSGTPAIDKDDPEHGSKIARNVTESMLDVASSSHVSLSDGRPVASKTGTAQAGGDTASSHNQAAWMVGYTPSVVTTVWTGNRQNDSSPIYGAYENYLGPTTHYDIFGREEPSFIWKKFMDSYLEDKSPEQFSPFEEAALGDSTPNDYEVPGVTSSSSSSSSSSDQGGNTGSTGGNSATGTSETTEPSGGGNTGTAPPPSGGPPTGGTGEPTGPTDKPGSPIDGDGALGRPEQPGRGQGQSEGGGQTP